MKKLCTKLVSPQINDVKWGYLILDKACIVFDKAKIVPMEQYGKTIKVYYNEEWYNKYLYFFPYYKSVDINLYSLWHIEQPLSLNFNGERLEIWSNQVIECSFQHYIKENYQSCILPAKEPEQEKVIELFPKSDKMAEGEYYILLDEIENSIIPVYKPIPVCYYTHYGFTFSKTENTISKYQLLGGCKSIYLFNEYQEFVLKLKEIIKNKYNNKLYTYQGKTPIKLEVDYRRFYIDEDGYIQGAGLSYYHLKNELAHKIEQGEINKVKGIVLHRTNGPSASSAMNWWYQSKSNVGTHFVIDKDGTIYQTASLLRYTYHHNNHRPGVTIKNNNSIGIEVAAKYIETQRIWEPATENQLISIRFLIHILLDLYKLSENDIFEHDKISYKTGGEGEGLYEKNN